MNRNVFITGATSGFGKAIAYKFAAQNDHLILCGRRMERLLAIKNELETEYGVEVRVFSFDIQDKNQIDEALNTWLASNPRIDILVNNAGLAAGLSSIEEGSLDDWERMIDTNVKGLLYISRKILPLLKQQRSGHVFNISSTAGKIVYKIVRDENQQKLNIPIADYSPGFYVLQLISANQLRNQIIEIVK